MKQELFEKTKEILFPLMQLHHSTLYAMSKKQFSFFKIQLKENNIDLSELNEHQREELNFKTFSKESEKFGLIPLYIFYLLDDEVKLSCPLIENKHLLKKYANDDVRFGCVAYEFYRG